MTDIETAKPAMIIQTDPKIILDQRREFPGTAAVADALLPYYQTATSKLPSTDESAVNRLKKTNGTYAHLPETLAKEVRENLTSLQASALQFEAAGDVKRAGDIRNVAGTLGAMLQVIQEMALQERTESAVKGK